MPRPFSKAPRLTVYRCELYDCAECINLCLLLRNDFPQLEKTLETVVAGILKDWIKPDGSFRSRKLMFGLGQCADASLGAIADVPRLAFYVRETLNSKIKTESRDLKAENAASANSLGTRHLRICAAFAARLKSPVTSRWIRKRSAGWRRRCSIAVQTIRAIFSTGRSASVFAGFQSLIWPAAISRWPTRRNPSGLSSTARFTITRSCAPNSKAAATSSAPTRTPRSSSTATSNGARTSSTTSTACSAWRSGM